jgi:photosystem II stability/assembly factor-like uncharacterized protein
MQEEEVSMTKVARLSLSALAVLSAALTLAGPQPGAAQPYDGALLNNLEFRNIGPFHGGRATTGVGVPGDKLTYYMGSTGGGVWKTTDGGETWNNVSDKVFNTGSIGDIAVYAGDPKILYVGTGEAPVRGQMSSYGDGVYKSTDAGKTWTHIGLDKTMQISRVVINPTNPNIVYVAAQGNRWTPSADRGVYKSTDGGATWKRILFSSETAGASELQMDPYDPNVLYAAFWDMQRFPWALRSGGPGSGLWKSTDGGEHWMQLKTGLPKVMGKIRMAVSPANTNRLYASIESEKSGLFRSDDAGQTWQEINSGGGFATRPWYYLGVAADPKNADVVYVSSSALLKSVNGGKTFVALKTHHGDTHTLWINPTDPQNMIDTDDGGAEISFNGGKGWTNIDNQPTAQFYTVRADDLYPYNLYAGQQDSSALKVASRTFGGGEEGPPPNWKAIASNEAARPSFDPKDPRFVFTSNYQGAVVRTDMDTAVAHDVSPWPGQKLGFDASQMTYRFNWSPPTLTSQFDAKTIYLGANVLFRTRDQGLTWDVISPDLTRNEKDKHERSGLWWHDGSGGEIYNTIYAVAESPLERGLLWVGTDDGLVQITRDDGKSWTNVTPGEWKPGWVYTIEPSPYDKATAYVAVSRHRTGDLTPHLYKTTDFGRTWTDLAATLPQDAPARVVRADPVRKGLLYAATEYRMWFSFDDGAHWQPFQQNLPHTPVSDILVHDNDLVVSTEGRGFWILDDLTTLRQLSPDAAKAPVTLFKPRDTRRIPGGGGGPPPPPGFRSPVNPPEGVIIRYALAADVPATSTLKLDILDASGAIVRTYTVAPPPKPDADDKKDEKADASCDKAAGDEAKPADAAESDHPQTVAARCKKPSQPTPVYLKTARGLEQVVWNFREAPVKGAKGDGPMTPRGQYTARLTLDSIVVSQSFEVLPDPRVQSSADDERQRQALTRHIMEVSTAAGGVYNELRDVLKQARELQKQAKGKSAEAALESFIGDMEKVEHLYQPPYPKGPGEQMVLTTGMGPLGQFGPVQGAIDDGQGPIDQGDRLRVKEVEALCAQVQGEADAAMNTGLPRINAALASAGLSAIVRHPGVEAPPPDPDDKQGLDDDL